MEGKVYHAEYERLHSICFTCGLFGHNMDICPISIAKRMEAQANGGSIMVKTVIDGTRMDGERSYIYGKNKNLRDWIIVPKKRRCLIRDLGFKNQGVLKITTPL